jgi:hypothetical protein
MRLNLKMFSQGFALLSMIAVFAGCAQDENVTPQNLPVTERGLTIGTPNTLVYGLSDRNEIVKLMSGPPATEISRVNVSGLRQGDVLLAIDIRPATHTLYGISASGLLYTIDPTFGIAQVVSLNPIDPPIGGSLVGFDFDPKGDRVRLVTEKGQNIRINPTTGAVSNIDFPINPPTAAVNSIAYSLTASGLAGSPLYDIGITEGKLYIQNPVSGNLSPVGSLGLAITGEGGFDIGRNSVAFAVLFAGSRGATLGGIDNSDPAYRLYSINLKTGAATTMGKVKTLIGLAIP